MAEYNSRETAKRAFAEEFNQSYFEFRESDDERAPRYTLLRTGDKANRFLLVGTMTEKEDVGSDSEYWRARVVDPTGTFFVYAGQYEPEAVEVIRSTDTPAYVAVIGKADSYEPDDAEDEDDVMMSIQAETVVEVDQSTRDNWVAEAAEDTLDRINNTEGEYVGRAEKVYDTDRGDFKSMVAEALEDLEGADEEAETAEAE